MTIEPEKWLRENRIDEIECMVPDLTGMARGKILPRDRFIKSITDNTLRMPDGVFYQTVTGEWPEPYPGDPTSPDMILHPDVETLRLVPWYDDPTAQVLCDVTWRDGTAGRRSRRARCCAACSTSTRRRAGARSSRPSSSSTWSPRTSIPTIRWSRRSAVRGAPRVGPPGLWHRCGQRVRPRRRRHLRLLRGGPCRPRHPDPRGGPGPARDQLPPRRSPWRWPTMVTGLQARQPRGRAAPQHLLHLHGQADRGRGRLGHAHPPVRGRQPRPAATSSPTTAAATPACSAPTSPACSASCPAAMPLFAPNVNSYRRLRADSATRRSTPTGAWRTARSASACRRPTATAAGSRTGCRRRRQSLPRHGRARSPAATSA